MLHYSKAGQCNNVFGRAVLPQDGLTIGKTYQFKSYRVLANKKNQDIAILVTIVNDHGDEAEYNFRMFEEAFVVTETITETVV